MFYENRAKLSLLQKKSLSRDESVGLRSKNHSKTAKSASSQLYQTILESQSVLLKKKTFTPSKRLSVLKKDFRVNRLNHFSTARDESPPSNSNLQSPLNRKEFERKNDKINELFVQIIKDQEDGIQSPKDINSSYRKQRKNKLVSKIDKTFIEFPSMKIPTLAALNHFGETKNSIIVSSEKKYKYLKTDSKFQEIVDLQKENCWLKKEMNSLQNELNGKNDLTKNVQRRNNENHLEMLHEKRISILKSQITKQKRYIKNLHKSLRLMKKFYRDMTSILLLFKNLDLKYAEMLKNQEKILYKKPRNMTRNDESIIKEIDDKQKFDSLQQILHGAKNGELLEKFMTNFNEAYEKVKGFERKNEELKKMFEITDADITEKYKDKVKKIKYNYLLREFIQKYKRYLPVKTFFDILEPKDKDNIDNHMTKLIRLMNKIEEVFQQVSAFDKTKKNPFFSQLSLPDTLKDNFSSFEGFLSENHKNGNLTLNYQSVSEVESSLTSLLRELANFQINLSTGKQQLDLEIVMNLQKCLRDNVEKLLEIGIILSEGDDPLVILQNEAGMSLSSMINEKKNADALPFKKNLYKNESVCNNDYQRIYSFLQESVSDLEESIGMSIDDNNKKKLHNFKFYLLTLNRLYEQKKITSFLKDLDLTMQSQRIDLINKGFDSLKVEIFEKMKSFEEFFQSMSDKVAKLGQHFDLIFENINEEKKKIVFDHSKKVQNLLKFMAMTIEKKMGQKEFNEMNLNLASLDEEYKIKIKVIEDKWNSFSKRIKNILDILNQTIK